MNVHPAKAAFVALAQQGNVIPVYADLVADFETPVSAYAKLKDEGPAYLLESVEGGENVNRYSFIGCRPRLVYACGPAITEIRRPGHPVERIPTPRDPLTLIQREIAGYRPVTLPGMPRFMGGAVGYIGYEYVTRIEPTVPVAPVPSSCTTNPKGLTATTFPLARSPNRVANHRATIMRCRSASALAAR